MVPGREEEILGTSGFKIAITTLVMAFLRGGGHSLFRFVPFLRLLPNDQTLLLLDCSYNQFFVVRIETYIT